MKNFTFLFLSASLFQIALTAQDFGDLGRKIKDDTVDLGKDIGKVAAKAYNETEAKVEDVKLQHDMDNDQKESQNRVNALAAKSKGEVPSDVKSNLQKFDSEYEAYKKQSLLEKHRLHDGILALMDNLKTSLDKVEREDSRATFRSNFKSLSEQIPATPTDEISALKNRISNEIAAQDLLQTEEDKALLDKKINENLTKLEVALRALKK